MFVALLLPAALAAQSPVPIPPTCPPQTTPASHGAKLGPTDVTRYVCKSSSGRVVGPWVAVYPNGKVAQTGSYSTSGKLHGELVYFNVDGARVARTHFLEGEETGERGSYHDNGAIRSVGPVVAGQPDGLWSFFHPNGRKESEGEMRLGQAHGAWTYWDEAGKVLKNGDWDSGKKIGLWYERDGAAEDFKRIEYQAGTAVVAEPEKPASLDEVRCRQIAEGRYVLAVSDVPAVSGNWPEGVMKSARLAPAYRGGEAFGYKIFAIPDASFVASCGFLDGDVIRAVNDVPTNSLESFEVAADRVRARGSAVFHVERDHRIVLVRIEQGPDVGMR